MGNCSSASEALHNLIDSVNEDDIQAVKSLLIDMWSFYNRLDNKHKKKLDRLANKLACNSRSP